MSAVEVDLADLAGMAVAMGPAAPAGCEATHTIVGAADVALVFVAESSAVTLVKKLTTFFSPNTKSRAAPYLFLHPAFLLCLSHLMVRDRDDLLAAVSKLAAAFPTATLEELLPDHVMVAQLLKIEYEGKITLTPNPNPNPKVAQLLKIECEGKIQLEYIGTLISLYSATAKDRVRR